MADWTRSAGTIIGTSAMRTTPEENAQLGRILAEKANKSAAPYELDCNINDAAFAEAVSTKLLGLLKS